MNLVNLSAQSIPLDGKHLIEASAGTGKTYNITRIYLRLLLERELTVEQILLMTFTKDATQELRDRIGTTIRAALSHWDELCHEDDFFREVNERVNRNKVMFLLKRALLFLDDAAIFTIHGFCQRVLSQHAFSSGLPFNATMTTNSSDLMLQACEDWYRQLAKTDADAFNLLADFWPTPSSFMTSFSKAMSHTANISSIDAKEVEQSFNALLIEANNDLQLHDELFEQALIVVKKGEEQSQRRAELAQLKQWFVHLIALSTTGEFISGLTTMPDSFCDGRRYSRSKFKAPLQQAFAKVNEVKSQIKKIHSQINKAKAFSLVKSGIYQMREQVIETKKRLNLLDFDDLINTLAQCLQHSNEQLLNGATGRDNLEKNNLALNLLAQYPVALVDEFQDTDPKQFAILQAIYYSQQANESKAGLYLIGDPKQAIYGFRGGDIFAYLSARSGCDYHWLMDTNWRSTPEMIDGYNQVFTLAAKDDEATDNSQEGNYSTAQDVSVFGYGIPYAAVKAGKPSETSLDKTMTSANKALELIYFRSDEDKVSQSARTAMAHWCADEISQLLAEKHIEPQDIAILVRDGAEATNIKQALQAANLDSVFLSDRANLFHSQQAQQLLLLLKALLHYENERIFLAGLCCGLLGFNASALHALQQDELAYQTMKFAFVDYRAQWQRQGFISMAVNMMHQHFQVPAKDKDRALTNLLHLFELLQSASQRFHQPQELLYWFEQQLTLDTPEIEAELRLESDADLIRIVTQHGSKGLEYPIVFIPFASRHKDPLKFGNKSVSYIEYHDEQGKLHLSLDGSQAAKQAMCDEAYAEAIRLLYVAVTRAEKRCYLLGCHFDKYHLSPLGKTLQLKEGEPLYSALQALQKKSEHAIGLKEVLLTDESACSPSCENSDMTIPVKASTSNPLVSQFTGSIERDWWLSSFSALSRNMRHVGISMPDRDSEIVNDKNHAAFSQQASLLRFELTKGAHSGNLLHDILEHVDFNEANWPEAIKWPLVKYGELSSPFTEADLIAWLADIITCPFLSPQTGVDKGCLADIPLRCTIRESEFYFPMQKANAKALASLVTEHRRNALNQHGEAINRQVMPVQLPHYRQLSGMMHGFIDLIFQYDGKYYVCDYKSSHLGDHYDDYDHMSLLSNIEKNHYDLQYLIYSLALHRYLATTLEDYQVERDFGGVYYLYLRGMSSDKLYQGAGIYYRAIGEPLLNALDNVFKGDE